MHAKTIRETFRIIHGELYGSMMAICSVVILVSRLHLE